MLKGNAMIDGLDDYLECIKNDYSKWSDACDRGRGVRSEMTKEFCQALRYEVGSKYIKVIAGTSVHSFVCLKDNGKFKQGDILKAATWASPARNFPRGNLLTRNFVGIRWTGA
jgi:hypothetical protein